MVKKKNKNKKERLFLVVFIDDITPDPIPAYASWI
jgi:hypothetical protein